MTDVFLTPLKPPTKASISLESIQSCLYYLHVVTSEDDELRMSLEEQQRTEDAERLANTSPIQRKPLPLTPFANYPASQRPPTPPKSYPYYQPGLGDQQDDNQATRLAARGIHLRLNTRSEVSGVSVRRKPLGPRARVARELDENVLVSRSNAGGPPENPIRAGPDPNLEPWPRIEDDVRPSLPPRTAPPLPPRTKNPAVHEADRIVLIRRDPSSGSQWNVGTIAVANSGLSATIEIHTPGYRKFAKQDLEMLPQPSTTAQVLQDENSTISASPISNHTPAPHFLRTIDMLALNQPKLGRSAHQRNHSEDIYSLMEQKSMQAQVLSHSRCIFTSPWKGQCFFTTGLDGRSLKCRHALPVASSTGETSSEPVCEIRFNLPWLRMRKKTQTQSEGENGPATVSGPRSAEAKQVFRRSVQRLRSASGSKTLSEDEKLRTNFESIKSRSNAADQQHRLDLSLGQEKAGGGFRGASAKLGKLIIEDEGLKFADLAVGACMSIWWTHYSNGDGG